MSLSTRQTLYSCICYHIQYAAVKKKNISDSSPKVYLSPCIFWTRAIPSMSHVDGLGIESATWEVLPMWHANAVLLVFFEVPSVLARDQGSGPRGCFKISCVLWFLLVATKVNPPKPCDLLLVQSPGLNVLVLCCLHILKKVFNFCIEICCVLQNFCCPKSLINCFLFLFSHLRSLVTSAEAAQPVKMLTRSWGKSRKRFIQFPSMSSVKFCPSLSFQIHDSCKSMWQALVGFTSVISQIFLRQVHLWSAAM